jgi:hypothetical protein
VSKMLQNSPKRICDLKIFRGYTPGPPLKRAGKEKGGKKGELRREWRGGEGRGREGREEGRCEDGGKVSYPHF